jgi:hypothetical protein
MSPSDSPGSRRRDLNNGSHVLDLSIRARVYVGRRLHDRGRKICSYTPFFRPDGALPADGSAGKTSESIPTGSTTQSTGLSIPIEGRKKRRRQWGAATTEQEAIYAKLLVVNATIGGMTARVFIDLGCQGNYVSPAFLRKARIPQKTKQNLYGLYTFDNQPMLANKGRIDKETGPISVTVGTHQEMLNLDVTETFTYDATFGLPWLKKHDPRISYRKGVIKFENCECQPTTEIQEISLKAMAAFYKRDPDSVVLAMVSMEKGPDEFEPPLKEYRRFKPLFQKELGKEALPKHQPWDHEILLVEGKQPKAQPIYSLFRTELEALREYINKNKVKGYIREFTSLARYLILFVPKSDGKLRLCVDYRRFNEITVKNRYTLPLIHEMQDRIKGAKWFTKLDLRDGYYRIRIKEGDEWKIAFGSRLGHYEYLVMPFGLTNAPASYQSLINNIFRKYLDDFVVAYLDDILIYSKTKEEHIKHVTAVLEALEKADVRINGAKSVFHV